MLVTNSELQEKDYFLMLSDGNLAKLGPRQDWQ